MTSLLDTLVPPVDAPVAAPAPAAPVQVAMTPQLAAALAKMPEAERATALAAMGFPVPAAGIVVVPSGPVVVQTSPAPAPAPVVAEPEVSPVEASTGEVKRGRGRPAKSVVTVEIPGELAERLIAVLERLVKA